MQHETEKSQSFVLRIRMQHITDSEKQDERSQTHGYSRAQRVVSSSPFWGESERRPVENVGDPRRSS